MSLTIFLSHAWRDKELAAFKAIEAKLRGAGYHVWVDKREIEYGEPITPRLDQAIAAADIVLVLWSENARDSEAVRHEIARTVELGKPLIPCKIGALEPGSYPPLRDRKYLRFDTNLDFGLLQLSQFLARWHTRRHAVFQGHPGLQQQISALNEALVEMEDSLYRREKGVSGNAASSEYIHSMLEAGKTLIATSSRMPADEKARIAQFMSRVQDIARAHPRAEDDALKEALMVDVIAEVDPHGQSSLLQTFRQALAQSVAARRGGSPAPTPRPSPPHPATHPPPVATASAMFSANPLHAHIAAIRQAPNADLALRQRLEQLLPGASADTVQAHERTLNQAIDAIPAMLAALAQAAQQTGGAHLMTPLLQQVQGYFFTANDLVPDHYGSLGLLDDAYLVHALLYQVNTVYRAHTGVLLIPYDPSSILQVLRAVLGPGVTQQLDQAVVGAVHEIVQQTYYQQMVQQRMTVGGQGGRTGGPGSWGGSWEDEMARMGAEIGISFN